MTTKTKDTDGKTFCSRCDKVSEDCQCDVPHCAATETLQKACEGFVEENGDALMKALDSLRAYQPTTPTKNREVK